MSRRGALAVGALGVALLGLAGPGGVAAGAGPGPGQGPASETAGLPPTTAAAALALATAQDAPVPPPLVNDEVGVATLDPAGLPERATLISRVAATGPEQEVLDPASVTNVRYLDRLGRPETDSGGVLLTVGGTRGTALTQARFDKPLPVALHVEYALDGQVVPAAEVPGASGDVRVAYTVTNTTAEQTELTWQDAAGVTQRSERPVFAPFQGVLTVTLPADAQLLEAPSGSLATDAQGRTVVRWTIAVHPPISAPVQRVALAMRTQAAAVPAADLALTPVTSSQDPAGSFADGLLSGAQQGNDALYEGLTELDQGALGVADGSQRLAEGLGGLAGGADQVAGGADSLAGGINELAAGADQVAGASSSLAAGIDGLAGGAEDLATGTTSLAGALDEASTGAGELAAATAQLAVAAGSASTDPVAPLLAGGQQLEAGLRAATARVGGPSDPLLSAAAPLPDDGNTTCPPGGTAPPDDDCVTVYQGVRAVRGALRGMQPVVELMITEAQSAVAAATRLQADVTSARTDTTIAKDGAAAVLTSLCPTPASDPSCTTLQQVADAAARAEATLTGDVDLTAELVATATSLTKQAVGLSAALQATDTAARAVLDGVEALGVSLGQGTPTQPGLTAGMAALNEGLRQLSAALAASQQQLAGTLTTVAAGNAQLATSLGSAATGAGELATGADRLAGGAGEASSGAEDLASGAGQLAQGAGSAATGAQQLAQGAAGLATGSAGAADASEALARGSAQLQQDGTAPAAASVLEASTDPAEAQAWMAAADARATDALPYGAPEGAVGHVAYLFTLPAVDAPQSLWDRLRGIFG